MPFCNGSETTRRRKAHNLLRKGFYPRDIEIAAHPRGKSGGKRDYTYLDSRSCVEGLSETDSISLIWVQNTASPLVSCRNQDKGPTNNEGRIVGEYFILALFRGRFG